MSDAAREDDAIRVRMKRELRRRMRAVRKALPPEARANRSQRIVQRLLTMPEFEASKILLGFSPLPTEVDIVPLLDVAHRSGKRVGLPRVVDDALEMFDVTADTVLEAGANGVMEPPSSSPRMAAHDIDFAVVPALAFDPSGNRLGYGGGYYDRFLANGTNAFTCVVGYDFQLLAELPTLTHDMAVRAIVTDDRVIRV